MTLLSACRSTRRGRWPLARRRRAAWSAGCLLFRAHLADRRERLERGRRSRAQGAGSDRERARARARRRRRRASARPRSSAASTSTIPRGERHAIIGPNGAGKSTLFNLISGRFAPTRGDDPAQRRGRSPALRPFEINRRGLSRSFQVTNIFPRLSVFENLRCARAVVARLPVRVLAARRRACTTRDERAERMLEQIGLDRAARRAGRRAHLRRAARARDRHHHRRRRRA